MKMCLVQFPSGNIYIAEKRGNMITLISQFIITHPVGSISELTGEAGQGLSILVESELAP